MTSAQPESGHPFDPASVMRRDVARLQRLAAEDPQRFEDRLLESQAELDARRRPAPRIEYPPELPITAHVDEIAGLLERHQVLVVAGETGSGKTTQLPKIALAAGYGRRAMIGHTQPRRLAARSVAARIAEELGTTVGDGVGFAVRFSDQVGPRSLVKLVTDGLLLTEIRRDRLLENYDLIIVDEAHERSLNIDFLLGYLKRVLQRRADLKLIITSATIDVDAFSRHFGDAPVVTVGGRGYPVAVHYLEQEQPYEEALLETLATIEALPPGRARDVLLFQSGEREIRDTAKLLRDAVGDRLDIVPLYARLSPREQQRVFQPGRRRRVVLATNVAETSITVPNIGYVIDPGFARISRYSFHSKLQRLPVEPISRASANQRMGRCGRVAPGVCFRLYAEADFLSRSEFTDPEIRRTNLASVVLQMQAFGLGDVRRFPFLEPPDPRAVRDAEKLLAELQALQDGRLTRTGRSMARLPVDPRLARMLIGAETLGCLTEVLIIVSGLAVQDPRERPLEKRGTADRAHEAFADERSDYLALLNLWRWHEEFRQTSTRSAITRELEKRFLSPPRMREWRELHRQLLLALRELGMRGNDAAADCAGADYASIHQAILTGSLGFIGLHDEKGSYLGPRNLRFRIFPGSSLAGRTPKWLMAAEVTETTRVYARCVAAIEPAWIERAAGHLLKRQYHEPHWSARRGEAQAYETVTLYGLPLAERRRISYRRIDPAHSRDLLIREGLVRGAVTRAPEFLEHNLSLVLQLLEREAKGRRRGLLAGEDVQAALYAERIPETVCTLADLAAWWRGANAEQRRRLFFSERELTANDAIRVTEDDYPPELRLRDVRLPLRYTFAPGEPDDGVSVRIPLGALQAVVPEALEWSVPGFFPAVCEQWLKSLPKNRRRYLAPISDKVDAIAAWLLHPERYRQGRLPAALATALETLHGVRVGAADWDRSRIDAHLLINVQVVDGDDRVLAQGRDLATLQQQFASRVRQRVEGGLARPFEQSGLTAFPAGLELDAPQVIEDASGRMILYPALVDRGDHVDLKLLPTAEAQRRANERGYPRLALLQLGQTGRQLRKRLARDTTLALHYAALGPGGESRSALHGSTQHRPVEHRSVEHRGRSLEDEVCLGAVRYRFFEDAPLPASDAAFESRLRDRKSALPQVFDEVVELLRRILALHFEIRRTLAELRAPVFSDLVADISGQLARLVPPDVLMVTPHRHLADLVRYLEAVRYRLQHRQGRMEKDRQHARVVQEFEDRLERLSACPGLEPGRWYELRFAVEELRIALFAEPLGTRGKISPQRLDRQFRDVERELGLI